MTQFCLIYAEIVNRTEPHIKHDFIVFAICFKLFEKNTVETDFQKRGNQFKQENRKKGGKGIKKVGKKNIIKVENKLGVKKIIIKKLKKKVEVKKCWV